MRRILANLLCEDELASAFSSRSYARASPSRRVLEAISRHATRLRAFAREGDHLWTPAPVDAKSAYQTLFVGAGLVPAREGINPSPTSPGASLVRDSEQPRLPSVVWESGPLDELPSADEVLAWCETPAAAAHRKISRDSLAISLDAPLHELLWNLPTAEPRIVAAVHHRAFHLRVAEEIGCALPGARMVESLSDLDHVLRHGPRSWVVKAPLSASGRDRYIERCGPEPCDAKARRTVERLFERHGPLLFEPWMDRIADFGVSALLAGAALRIVGIHRQQVDRKGQFERIDLEAGLSGKDRNHLLETAEAVAEALRRAGYVGPFGIDGWSYRREDGSIVFNPLGEINARMTFGLVAWALAERSPAT